MKESVSCPKRIPAMPQNPLLVPDVSDPTLARLLRRPTGELAQATRPSFLNNEQSPVQWSRSDWDRLEANSFDIFDMSAVAAQFNHASFVRDGYAVLRGVMTPEAVEEWTAGLKYGQQLNDTLLTSDWAQIDWHGVGRTPPTKSLTADEINNALGGSQRVPQSDDDAGVKTLRQHSVFAEYFPAGHVPFLMNVLTHPQMLQLQRMCLGCDDIYFDHNQLLTRQPGYPGGAWHSHKIGGGVDNCGPASLSEYQAQPNFNLTLCYPQGFEAGDDGGLKLVRGSHLFRDPAGCRAADDEEMQRGWLAGRVHPVTSEPLFIEHLSLPPGSIVCCLSHAAHAVAPKALGRKPRWCSLYCYKKPNDVSGYAQPSHSVPPVWAMKAQRGELPAVLTELLRPSYDKELTGGRTFDAQP
ncbi:MAG: hypothetical protein O7E52_01385 [Candidatus Poribacteria bacterium]|nr:hypothetical protein [Candidatus Poribacteria bacterium]